MDNLVETFKDHVVKLCQNPSFVHSEWFVEYHLEIVERIALELCDVYPTADRSTVKLLVWLHDYGKIVDFDNQYSKTLTAGYDALVGIGFPEAYAKKVIGYIELYDKKENLGSDSTPLEVKIVSSADGASHLVGPFFPLYWKENSSKSFKDLMRENVRKATVDWEKKVVLPEVKKAFEERHQFFLNQVGPLPDHFL